MTKGSGKTRKLHVSQFVRFEKMLLLVMTGEGSSLKWILCPNAAILIALGLFNTKIIVK